MNFVFFFYAQWKNVVVLIFSKIVFDIDETKPYGKCNETGVEKLSSFAVTKFGIICSLLRCARIESNTIHCCCCCCKNHSSIYIEEQWGKIHQNHVLCAFKLHFVVAAININTKQQSKNTYRFAWIFVKIRFRSLSFIAYEPFTTILNMQIKVFRYVQHVYNVHTKTKYVIRYTVHRIQD